MARRRTTPKPATAKPNAPEPEPMPLPEQAIGQDQVESVDAERPRLAGDPGPDPSGWNPPRGPFAEAINSLTRRVFELEQELARRRGLAVSTTVDFYDPRGADGLRPRAAIVVGMCSAPGLVHLRVFGNPDVDHARPESWLERNVPFVAAIPAGRSASVAYCCPAGTPSGAAATPETGLASLDPGSGV